MIIVSNSKGVSVEFECIQAMLDFFPEEEGDAILLGEHSEYNFTFGPLED